VSIPTAQSEDARRLKRRLRAELRWLRLRIVGHAGVMLLGSLGLLLAAAVVSSPGWMGLGSAGARLVQGVLALAALWILVAEVVVPLRRVANLKGFSRQLEYFGRYENLLEAATQFTSPRRRDPLRYGASADLVAEILRRARREAERTSLSPAIPLVGVGWHVGLVAMALLAWLVLAGTSPARIDRTFEGLVHPARLAETAPTEGLYPVTGDLRVAVGASATLVARDFVGGDDDVVVEINRSGDFWQQLPVEVRPAAEIPAPYVDAVAEVAGVEDPFQYRFRKAALTTPVYHVSVRERPVLKELAARLEPPAYTGRPATEHADLGGTISVLEGTRVFLEGHSSTPLSAAARLVDGRPPHRLTVGGSSFTDTLTIDEDLSFRIRLVDQEGLESQVITVYRFTARPDDPPTVQITAPGQDVALDRDLRVPIAGLAADDVGLARMDLLYRSADETEWSRRPLFPRAEDAPDSSDIVDLRLDAGNQELGVGFVWNLSDHELFPGDTVLYCLEATDNNALKGGQSTRSGVFRLRLPTIAEVFDIQREERDEHKEDLTDILAEGKDLQETLERLNRELKKDPDPDWAKQQEIRDALERQQELRSHLKDATENLDQMLDEFQRNNSGSMEILEKMQTIQELMNELQDESLQAYLEAMQEAMDQLQPHEIQRAMEDALAKQEEYNRRLDRTIELLQQLERERTMSDLVEETSEYMSRQEDLRQQTENLAQRSNGEPQTQTSEADDEQRPSPPQTSESRQGEQNPETSAENPQDAGDEESRSQMGEANDEQNPETSAENPQDAGDQQNPSENLEKGESSESESSQEESSPSGDQKSPMSEEEIARAQEQLAKEAEALEKRLQEALEKLQEQMKEGSADDPGASEMKKALEDAQEQMKNEGAPSESMGDASEQLAEGKPGEAQENQKGATERLVHLYEVLAQGQQGMQMATEKFAVEKLQQLAYDLLHLSFSEEKLVDALDETAQGQRLAPVTREQGRIQRSAARLSKDLDDLARKNFMIPEKLLSDMRQLAEVLERSVEELQLTRSRRSRDTATSAMGQMNRVVMSLLTAAQGAGGKGSGAMASPFSPSQQMEQLSQDQSRLNRMTDELRQRMEGGLSPEERQQLAELRAQQEAIRQQLKDVRRQIEDERRVLGDLGDLGKEMEEVVQDLDAGRLTDDTRRQQEHILSRLLDAQKSIRERDFAKRRESRSGEQLFGLQEGTPLAGGTPDAEQQVRRWLAPEKAPHAYQDDVRQYFRQIQNKLEEPQR
jgi:hypothetical protein